MKTHLFLLCYFVVFCHAQNPAIQSPATDTNYVSMKINGVEWKSSVGAGVVLADGFSAKEVLEVTGGKEILAITLVNCTAIGTSFKIEATNYRLFNLPDKHRK